jgi:hypothetical protein
MEIVIFLVFVGVCALVLVWSARKSKAETDLARRKKLQHSEKLGRPADNLLAHNRQLWEERRKKAAMGVSKTNAFVPKFESEGMVEYDGYSRRDRHHVRDRNAEIKGGKKQTDGGIAMSSVGYKRDKEPARS